MSERLAVIVIGSNSTRLLCAQADESLSRPVRGRAETRLFLGMTAGGALGEEALTRAARSVMSLREQAQADGARLIGVYATSAVRDASNAALLRARLGACGHTLRVLSGREEAAYAFYGAAADGLCGVIDIGGGSTEVIVGEGMDIRHMASIQMGASRLFQRQPVNESADIARARDCAQRYVSQLPEEILRHEGAEDFYIVGGTGTSCAALLNKAPLRHGQAQGACITRDALRQALRLVADTARERRPLLPGFPPTRADILPTGMVILGCVMDVLGLACVTVTERGNTDGLLRAAIAGVAP